MLRHSGYLALLAVLVPLSLITACSSWRNNPPVTTFPPFPTSAAPSAFTSNGQRIYFTATSSSGQPIIARGFTMMMGYYSCANCPGADGHGGTVYMLMMQRVDVPDITWPVLTGPYDDHVSYTVDTVKRAITQGFDPAGHQLKSYMPRWQMSAPDLDDVVGYLQGLK